MRFTQKLFHPYLVGLLFILAGFIHFINSDFYVNIMPHYIPWHLMMVYVSGVFEVIGGVGVLLPPLRRIEGWGQRQGIANINRERSCKTERGTAPLQMFGGSCSNS